MSRLVRMKEAAGFLAISVRQLYRLIADGVLRGPLKVGSSSRIPLDELEAFVERQKERRRR